MDLVDIAECNEQHPWSVRVAGPQTTEDQASLVFDPVSPCGAELNAVGSQRVPLVAIAGAAGCVGGTCPGDLVLIRGHVQLLDRQEEPGLVRPASIGECEGYASAPRVKLLIRSCGWKGPVIIDSDSAIVVPAGIVSVDVLVPGPNTQGIPWSSGPQTLADATPWQHVNLKVTACACTCGYVPEGQLTEWLTMNALGDDRELVKPRRAVQVQVSASASTGGTSNISARFKKASSSGVTDTWGTFQAGASIALNKADVGAFPILELTPTAAQRAGIVWTIR